MKDERKKRRLLVVGDIHGHIDKLEQVLNKAAYVAGKDNLVLLGDYVDRGPRSREVLALVSQLVHSGAIALLGNHEAMMMEAMRGILAGNVNPEHLELWFANGGEATLRSYKDDRESLIAHLELLNTLPLVHEQEKFVFVHAGLKPGVAIEKQRARDLLWIRDEYISNYNGPWKVVSGHTPTNSLSRLGLADIDAPHAPVLKKHQIFMDTGAAWGGKLSVMELHSKNVWQA